MTDELNPVPPDESDDSTTPARGTTDTIGRGSTGTLLRTVLQAANTVGPNAEKNYQDALTALRQRADDAMTDIARAEQASDSTDYVTRWGLVNTATELRHAAAIPFLREMALRPVPTEVPDDPHDLSPAMEELMLRTTAIEGLERLAIDDHQEAVETLFECVRQPSLSVRRAAVQALLARPDSATLRVRIAALLPDDQQFLLTIKRVDVRDVEQIENPQRHLTEKAQKSTKPTAPRLAEDHDSPSQPRFTRSDDNDAPNLP